ncbi:MAG TPA: hypothetical protein RMH99_08385 [Sandaracinaceae bacterium LLY-WYZ-13_1]|nr:hypothetical protein [Sandaracinaceae bacterium LLY-WYZ-13_1]
MVLHRRAGSLPALDAELEGRQAGAFRSPGAARPAGAWAARVLA